MKTTFGIVVALVICSATAMADSYELSCFKSQPGNEVETKFFKQAASGAARISEHIIELKYSGGIKRFIDKPPYEPLGSGTLWCYCGYDTDDKFYLVGKHEGDLFGGVIVFEGDGKTLSAGHTVIVSPDKKRFLAIEQHSGVDGEHWTLNTMDGKTLWTGYSGILERSPGNNYDTVYAEFLSPSWDKE